MGLPFLLTAGPELHSLTLAYSLKQVLSELSLCEEPFGVTLARGPDVSLEMTITWGSWGSGLGMPQGTPHTVLCP